MARHRKTAHLQAHLRGQDLGCPPSHPRDGLQPLKVCLVGTQTLRDLGTQAGDLLQVHRQQQAMMRAHPSLQGLLQSIALAPQFATSQQGHSGCVGSVRFQDAESRGCVCSGILP